jgi:hypothetical protein
MGPVLGPSLARKRRLLRWVPFYMFSVYERANPARQENPRQDACAAFRLNSATGQDIPAQEPKHPLAALADTRQHFHKRHKPSQRDGGGPH